jgi:hypothetical protein
MGLPGPVTGFPFFICIEADQSDGEVLVIHQYPASKEMLPE